VIHYNYCRHASSCAPGRPRPFVLMCAIALSSGCQRKMYGCELSADRLTVKLSRACSWEARMEFLRVIGRWDTLGALSPWQTSPAGAQAQGLQSLPEPDTV
jgi:hypothetical protein